MFFNTITYFCATIFTRISKELREIKTHIPHLLHVGNLHYHKS